MSPFSGVGIFLLLFFKKNRGKPETDAVDRSFGERRYDPIQATPPPPPLPSQYTQPVQPATGSSVHMHSKGAHGEGRKLNSCFQE
jgi:tight junction protein 1